MTGKKDPPVPDCKLTIHARGLSGRTQAFTLILDEKDTSKIQWYEKEFPITPGKHSARVQYLFIKTNTVDFHLEKGSNIKLSWGASLKFLLIPVFMGLLGASSLLLPRNPETYLFMAGIITLAMPLMLAILVFMPGMLYTLEIEN